MSLEVSLELKQLIFGRLRSRNSASSANLGNVYLDYQKSLEKGSLLENRVFVLEREIQRLRSGEARNEDQGRARELEEKISKLQNELGASFKSIHEKSQLVLELREKALEDEKKVMDMSARMSKAQEECKEAMQEASRANLEISRLNEFIRQLNEEISSLRVCTVSDISRRSPKMNFFSCRLVHPGIPSKADSRPLSSQSIVGKLR